MSKLTLTFTLPEEKNEALVAQHAYAYKHAFEQVWEELFRKRHKHGYGDPAIDKLVDTPHGRELMDKLEELYRQINKELMDTTGDVE